MPLFYQPLAQWQEFMELLRIECDDEIKLTVEDTSVKGF